MGTADLAINHCLAGEWHISEEKRVWITKTHHPLFFRHPNKIYLADRIFVIVRNPLDVFPSYFTFGATGTHSMITEEKINE